MGKKEESFTRHRFSVPKADDTVREWMEAQSNLSQSLRQLIREYVRKNGCTDVTCARVEQIGKVGRPSNEELARRAAEADMGVSETVVADGFIDDRHRQMGQSHQVIQQSMSGQPIVVVDSKGELSNNDVTSTVKQNGYDVHSVDMTHSAQGVSIPSVTPQSTELNQQAADTLASILG